MSTVRKRDLEDCSVEQDRQVTGSNGEEGLFIRFGQGGQGLF